MRHCQNRLSDMQRQHKERIFLHSRAQSGIYLVAKADPGAFVGTRVLQASDLADTLPDRQREIAVILNDEVDGVLGELGLEQPFGGKGRERVAADVSGAGDPARPEWRFPGGGEVVKGKAELAAMGESLEVAVGDGFDNGLELGVGGDHLAPELAMICTAPVDESSQHKEDCFNAAHRFAEDQQWTCW